jgi:predicted DNA-binding WGR domain protein
MYQIVINLLVSELRNYFKFSRMNSTLEEFELEILPRPEDTSSRLQIAEKITPEPAISSSRPSTSTPAKLNQNIGAFRTEEDDRLIDVPNPQKKNEEIVEGYNVMLNLTDISYGVKGHNKFYQIQLLKRGNSYVLFTKWARVGAKTPQMKYDEFGSKIEGVKAFKKKFYEKTLNEWDDRDNFQQQEGKYMMINVDGTSGDADSLNKEVQRLNQRNLELKKRIDSNPSNLEKGIHILMKMIWDINRMSKTLKELNIDTDKNPLGKLKTDQIQKGLTQNLQI